MANKKTKILGIFVLFVAFLIASINSMGITNLSILDTDPATYVIVVMLMLFLFILFLGKEDIEFEYKSKNIIFGVLVFLVYLILLSYLRASLSFEFFSYRIDALLFPLLLLSFIITIFGISSLRKLFPIIIYSVFASPFLLLPLLNLNAGFANVNANIIYNFVRALGVNASKVGLVITSASGSSITISTTCVSLGTFIAFVMFLIPLAYLYDGKLKNKIYWIFSGIVLIVALNLLRMLSITLVWVYYGINSAASLFHTFAGQIIFYAAIIIMVLLYYKYGLAIGKSKKSILKDIKTFKFTDKDIFITCLVVVFLAIIAFGFSYNYSNAVIVPSTLLKSNLQISQIPVYQYVLSNMENSRSNVIVIENTPGGALFSLGASNLTSNQSIFALVNYTHQLSNSYNVLSYNSSAKHHYLLRNGITLTAQTAYSGNYLFDVNYFSAPYELNSTSATIVDYVLFREQNSSAIYCNAFNYSSDAPEYIESYIYNLIDSGNYNNKGLICQSYLIASSIK